MSSPSYDQVLGFANLTEQLKQAAIDEFSEYVHEGMTVDDVVDAATEVAVKFSYLGYELGAQWYDLCSQLAGLDVDAADMPDVDADGVRGRARSLAEKSPDQSLLGDVFNYFIQNEVQNSIRMTGDANLWRDYERGMAGGKWARVPVGDTCAWCLMLASQGAWYVSKESAMGATPDHYHDGCNCVAVYHADPESIAGYKNLPKYKSMYYEADNMRIANATGKRPYDDELQQRIDAARAAHDARFEAGETDQRWASSNETLIVMRYVNGLK